MRIDSVRLREQVAAALGRSRVVVLVGPRQVGKTARRARKLLICAPAEICQH
jgi:predicted AAA+ superfamily ATPase